MARRVIGAILLLLVLSLTFIFFWLYQFWGLKYYLRALYSAYKSPGRTAGVMDVVHGVNKGGWADGILAQVNQNYPGGIWFWSRNGLKYLRADEYSVFSFFDICRDEILGEIKAGGNPVIDRDIETDIKVWAEKVKPGDYVVVLTAGAGHGGMPGNLREAKAHNWWPFVFMDLEKQCAN